MEETIDQDSTMTHTISDEILRQTNTVLCQCKICGAPARYSYYGAVVCHPCKMFFKRNAEQGQAIFICISGNECGIDINNRRICSSCRLAKCFASGMCVEMIRSPCRKKNGTNQRDKLTDDSILSTTTVLARLGEKHQLEQISVLNLLQSDQSTLSIDQWNLLSNLVHCFDEHGGYSFVENFIQDYNTLPLKLRHKSSLVKDFFISIKCKIQLVFEKNQNFLSLSPYDRTTLRRTTLKYTGSIGGMFLLRKYKLLENPTFYNSSEIISRPNAVAFAARAIDQFDSDDTFIKLTLAIATFSTINYTVYQKNDQTYLTNIKVILPIQDMYTELAWRYLLYKYGDHQAVIRFSKLIRCLLLVNHAIVEAYESQQYAEIIDSVIEQTEQALSL